MSDLRYLCLFAYSGDLHILSCVFCFACHRHVSCVPNVAGFSGLFILDCPLIFSGFLIALWNSLTFCHLVDRFGYNMKSASITDSMSSSFVLCTQCYRFLWIDCLILIVPPGFSNVCIHFFDCKDVLLFYLYFRSRKTKYVLLVVHLSRNLKI